MIAISSTPNSTERVTAGCWIIRFSQTKAVRTSVGTSTTIRHQPFSWTSTKMQAISSR